MKALLLALILLDSPTPEEIGKERARIVRVHARYCASQDETDFQEFIKHLCQFNKWIKGNKYGIKQVSFREFVCRKRKK